MNTSKNEGVTEDALGAPLPEMTMSELDERAEAFALDMLVGISEEGRENFNKYAEEHPARVQRALAAYKHSFRQVMAQHFTVVMDHQAHASAESTFAPSY